MLKIFSADLPDMDQDGGLLTETSKPELKRPPMYKVILMNDDYTPMELSLIHISEPTRPY